MQVTEQPATASDRIPKFETVEEARAFWDNHSPEDFPSEFVEESVEFDRPLIKRGLTVKLSPETIRELTELARAQGIGPSTLARMWIMERLREQGRRTSRARSSSS